MTREDCISRAKAIEKADNLCLETGYDNEKVIEMLNDLPSVTPKTGHWKPLGNYDECGNENSYKCSECGERNFYPDNYCHNCGAKMEVEK